MVQLHKNIPQLEVMDQNAIDFLEQHNRFPKGIRHLKGDLGSRQFWRLEYAQSPNEILMVSLNSDHPNYTPGHDLDDYIRLGKVLRSYGLRVPNVYEYDLNSNICLIEDIGYMTYIKALNSGYSNDTLTREAGRILQEIQKIPSHGLPDFMSSHVMKGHKRFVDWYCPVLLGKQVDTLMINSFLDVWDQIFNNLPRAEKGFVYLDFHFGNLMLSENPEKEHGFETVLLDFQGAMHGPLSYDLTNLLQDARRDVSEDLHEFVFAEMVENLKAEEKDVFELWYNVLACQFHCRVIGQFIKLAYLHGKSHHLEHLPRLAAYIEKNTSKHEVLKPLRAWLSEYNLDLAKEAKVDLEKLPGLIRADAL